ncbi:hypothetical protein D3C73_806560 [compost metagenome]
MAIRVNMFSLRVTSDRQPRSKNGQPAQRTTGVASTSCSQFEAPWPITWFRPRKCPPISSTTTGSVSTSPIQNRRVMSMSSSFGSASRLTRTGSSAMPQIGHDPGPTCRISGCIGQV